MEREPLDLVAVGDIAIDAFIRIKDATVDCDLAREHCQLCFDFGGKVPYESVEIVRAVGNAPNVAVAASRLGLSTGLVTDLGDDHNGGECLATLTKSGVSTDYVRVHKGHQTNYHYVLWYEDERTILVRHEKYPYDMPHLPPPRWLYLSSLSESSSAYHHRIADYLKHHAGTRLAFQPGTFQLKLGTTAMRDFYKLAKILFCNKSEAARILDIADDLEPKELLKRLHDLGPETVIVTDGRKGAYAYDGVDGWFMPAFPDPRPVIERTGAGDSFSASVVAGLAEGLSLKEALAWGPAGAMSVVQAVGPQKGLLTRKELDEVLATAPKSYKAIKIF